MYSVNDQTFDSFFAAIAAAKALSAQVIEVETGNVRWTPAAPVSAKKKRMYAERKAAYAIQEGVK